MYRRVFYHAQDVDSLVSICIQVVAKNITANLQYAARLPQNLKSVLVTLLGRRGHLQHPVFRALAHRSLQTVDLSSCSIIQDAHISILQCCDSLVSLRIPRATVSSSVLLNLFPCIPHLKQLDMSACGTVDDEIVQTLCLNCRGLRHLTLSNCGNITDFSLKCIADNLHFLTALDISYTQISDEGIKFLSEGDCQSRLTELYIDGCANVTADSGEYIRRFPKLTNLSFFDCPELLESPYISEFSQMNRVRNLSFTV